MLVLVLSRIKGGSAQGFGTVDILLGKYAARMLIHEESEVYFSFVTHSAQSESLSKQLNRHWIILKLDPPSPTTTYRPFPVTEPTAWLLVLASGATWALSGSSYFITRTLLSDGCCLFHLASLLRTPEPWDCGTLLHSAADLSKNVNDVLPSPGRAGVLWCNNHYMMSNYYFVNYQQPQGPPGDMTSREAFDSCPKPAFMKNQNWQRRQKNVLKLVKENEALPSPWIVAGTGRLSQGHWWNFMSAASRSMGRDYEAPVLAGRRGGGQK